MLINTNGWYECEELNLSVISRLLKATNFVDRQGSGRADVQCPFRCEKKAPCFTAFKSQLIKLHVKRSQKVDLGRCKYQKGPFSIAGLRSKRVQTWEDPGVNGRLLIGNCYINYK